jgi:hypothetical protein
MLNDSNLLLSTLDVLHSFFAGEYARAWQSLGMACRLMQGLQLNWDSHPSETTRDFVQKESNRRIVWQLFLIDRVLAGGYDEYLLCNEDKMKLRLPCSDQAYRENRPVVMERLHEKPRPSTEISLYAYQIRLWNIRHHVLVVTKKFTSSATSRPGQASRMEASKVMEDINRLQSELARFGSSLPEELKLSNHSIANFMHSSDRPGFVMLHTWLCQLYVELYRFALPGMQCQVARDIVRSLPKEFVIKSQKQAVAHALSLARFWETVQQQSPGINDTGELVVSGDYMITPSIAQCSKVLLIALKYNLYTDLSEHSTAPLWRNEPASEASIRAIIEKNVQLLEPWTKIIPGTNAMVRLNSSRQLTTRFPF